MSLSSLLRRARESVLQTREQLDAEDERRGRLPDTTPIGEAAARSRVRLGGVLTAVTYPPADATPILRARLFDGTGTAELVFLGRRAVPGIEPGRRLTAEGTVADAGAGPVLYNPGIDLAPTVSER